MTTPNHRRRLAPVSAGWLALVSILALAGAAGCDGAEAQEPTVAEEPAPLDLGDRVRFEPAESAEWTVMLTLPAEVVLPPGATHVQAPPVTGRLVEWLVGPGDHVDVGDPLASMASLELADLETALREQNRLLRQRREMVERLEQHVDSGLQPVQSLYDAEAALSDATARRDALDSQLSARRQAGDSGESGSSFTWMAGAPGVVSQIDATVGATVAPGEPVLTTLEVARAEVLVAVPERYLSRVTDQTRLRWWPTAAGPDDPPLLLELRRRAPTIATSSRTRGHTFALPEGADERSRSFMVVGATGRGELMSLLTEPVVRVNGNAVTTLEGQMAVFVPDAEAGDAAGARVVRVDVVGRDGGDLIVRGALAPGDPVATRGAYLLKSVHLLAQD